MSVTEKDLLIKLPYRVGLWVCRADDAAGLLDDKVERARLKAVIERVAKQHESSGFVRNTLAKTLSQADKWNGWAADLDDVPIECKAGLKMVKAQSSDDDVKVFRVVLMQTAVCVAEAFQEEDPPKGLLIPAHVTANDPGLPQNISRKERKALEALKGALWE